jgi:acetyl/propionyl-CoA carboxylase alpha subunit
MKVILITWYHYSGNSLVDQQMESAVTAPVSGHVKRVAVQEGKWIGNQIKLVQLTSTSFQTQGIPSTKAI